MSGDQRKTHLDLVEKYFASVMREDFAAVRACFGPDAYVTILHGDNPRRKFSYRETEGESSVAFFYGHLWTNYHVKFYDFTFVIDAASNRGACYFQVTLTPKAGSDYAATGALRLNNCNFFRFEDGKIADMIIYYANPTLGATLGDTKGAPTAFPKG
jgi:ketosteroid isomerase-like protein